MVIHQRHLSHRQTLCRLLGMFNVAIVVFSLLVFCGQELFQTLTQHCTLAKERFSIFIMIMTIINCRNQSCYIYEG
jgi:hypothetical protein